MLPFSFIICVAYEITYTWMIINPLYAVCNLLLSLPLAHKLIICFISKPCFLTNYFFTSVSLFMLGYTHEHNWYYTLP